MSTEPDPAAANSKPSSGRHRIDIQVPPALVAMLDELASKTEGVRLAPGTQDFLARLDGLRDRLAPEPIPATPESSDSTRIYVNIVDSVGITDSVQVELIRGDQVSTAELAKKAAVAAVATLSSVDILANRDLTQLQFELGVVLLVIAVLLAWMALDE